MRNSHPKQLLLMMKQVKNTAKDSYFFNNYVLIIIKNGN
jgi:hypothetical protein